MQFLKSIKKEKKNIQLNFITEIENNFISYGANNEFIIYNDSYEKIFSFQTKEWIYNILVYNNKINKIVDLLLLISSKEKINIYSKEKNKYEYEIK